MRRGSTLKELRKTMMREHKTFKQQEKQRKHRKNIKKKEKLARLLSLKHRKK